MASSPRRCRRPGAPAPRPARCGPARAPPPARARAPASRCWRAAPARRSWTARARAASRARAGWSRPGRSCRTCSRLTYAARRGDGDADQQKAAEGESGHGSQLLLRGGSACSQPYPEPGATTAPPPAMLCRCGAIGVASSSSGARPTRTTSPASPRWSPTTCCCRSSRSRWSRCSSPAGCSRSEDVAALGARRPAAALPRRRRDDAERRRCARLQESSTTVGHRRRSSPRSGSRRSFWGALDTAFCRIYHRDAASWVRQKLFGLGMLGRRPAVLRRHRRRCRRCRRCCVTRHRRPAVRPLRRARRWSTAITLARRLVIMFVALCAIYCTRPERAGPVALRLAGRRSARRSAIGVVDYGFPLYLAQRRDAAGLARRSCSC